MTHATPPGWYPDPGQTSDGPATERWWDGTAWTGQVRPAGQAGAQPGAPVAAPGPYGPYPVHPGYPGHPGPPARRRTARLVIAGVVAVVVLAGIGVGATLLTDGDGKGDRADSRRAEPRTPGGQDGPGRSAGPDTPDAPKSDGGPVPDPVSGISLPVPDGWSGSQLSVGAAVTSDDSYPCPGDASASCTKGGAYSAPAKALGTKGTTAQEVAKADIAANAEESYGGKSYGGITSHQVLASKAVTVAGQRGWLVRWKAVTSKGSDGIVESLAFPAPAGAESLVVVRFGVDEEQTAAVIDEITRGIEKSSAGGGGNGQDV
ncbi:DUF2510 domain-containing protein [Streptomyces sp. NPDC048182]|uniref:DUF2510 domain-containing protein n=1 Tax=Streptomyces sp. NPDC048182 TaxID=3365507 RepID=UPI003711C982